MLSEPERRRQHDLELPARRRVGHDPRQLSRAYLQRGVKAYKEKSFLDAADNFDRATKADPAIPRPGTTWRSPAPSRRAGCPGPLAAIERACELEPMNPAYRKQAGRISAGGRALRPAGATTAEAITGAVRTPRSRAPSPRSASCAPGGGQRRGAGLRPSGRRLMRVKACGLSDVGLTRVHNEDYFEIDPRHRLYVVADGMGGHSHGEVAAQIAVDAIREFIDKAADKDTTWPSASTSASGGTRTS